ncbi:hypothetical protein Tco_0329973, partial [Tanacetum coccineum]
DRLIVSTDGSKVSTDRHIEGTDEQVKGTDEQVEGTEDKIESTDGQRKGIEDQFEERTKAVSREKEKGVELKDIEEANKPRPTSTRSLLTLKPLPKIDPKDKGKKKVNLIVFLKLRRSLNSLKVMKRWIGKYKKSGKVKKKETE